MDDILEDSFDQISSFNIIHRGIHARSTTGTEISKETVKDSLPVVKFHAKTHEIFKTTRTAPGDTIDLFFYSDG